MRKGYVEIPGYMVVERAASVIAQLEWERAEYVNGVVNRLHVELNKPTLWDRLFRRPYKQRHTIEEVRNMLLVDHFSWQDPNFDDWWDIHLRDDWNSCIYAIVSAGEAFPDQVVTVPMDEANFFAQLWDRYNVRTKTPA